jgi:hypothetical protein
MSSQIKLSALMLLILFSVDALKVTEKFTINPEPESPSENFITVKLNKSQTTVREKKEIMRMLSKSQSYLFNEEESNAFLGIKDSSKSKVNTASVNKISLYNYKNTQVLKITLIVF